MCIVPESLEESFELLVDVRVVRDVVNELIVVRLRGELTMPQQVRHLEKRCLLRELFDGISAVTQNSLVPVDERDRRTARCSVHERGIVAHDPEIIWTRHDLLEVDRA